MKAEDNLHGRIGGTHFIKIKTGDKLPSECLGNQ